MYYIGIDLGTTGCKSIVFDEDGGILGDSYIEYPLILISPSEIEQDADLWWELSCQAVYQAVQKSGISPSEVEALSVSSQGISFVLVDEQINTIGNAVSWLDIRSVEETEEIRSRYSDDRIFQITGKRINATYLLPKLLWVKKHRKKEWTQAHKLLMAHDFLIAKMTGEFITDHTMASGTMLYDINNQCWCSEILETFSIERDKLPEIRFSGTPVGKLKKEAAAKMGLTTEVIIGVGGQDQKVSALFVNPDLETAALSLGTAGALEFICDRPIYDPGKQIPCFSFLLPNLWTLEAVVSTTGACLKWLRNTLFSGQSYQQLDALCEQSPVGANGVTFYPHLGGATSPHWNAEQKGVFNGISLDTRQEDFVRAVLEGIAFQLKSNLLVYENLHRPITTINVFGGGAASNIWCQIISNITRKNIVVFSSLEISNLGAAKLAYLSAGKDGERFGKLLLEPYRKYYPQSHEADQYESLYKSYLDFEKKILAS